jgi:hypothetical protein
LDHLGGLYDVVAVDIAMARIPEVSIGADEQCTYTFLLPSAGGRVGELARLGGERPSKPELVRVVPDLHVGKTAIALRRLSPPP